MKGAIGAPQTYFAFAGHFQVGGPSPVREHYRKIFGMNRSLPSPAVRLFRGETGVVMPFPVNELYGAVRMTRPCQRGNSIDYKSNIQPRCGWRGTVGSGWHTSIIWRSRFPDDRGIP